MFVEPDELDDWPALAAAHEGVTAASGTPTFWRQALLPRPRDASPGCRSSRSPSAGEPVDQAILDRLTGALPDRPVSWIYASSEAGAIIAVHDGRAGFPVAGWTGCRAGPPTPLRARTTSC